MKEHTPPTTEQGTPTESPVTQSSKPRPSGLRWLWLPVIALLGAGAWYLWPRAGSTPSASSAALAKGGKKGGAAVVPVVAAKARRGDIGVYITGLGSVTPIYTVTVKSRVDGQLMKVHYNEGDLVHEGDLLVEIDPRPYQVALEQAEGQLARDQATLDNARVDVGRYQKLLAQNAVPEQQVATQKAAVAQAEQGVAVAQSHVAQAEAALAQARAGVQAARVRPQQIATSRAEAGSAAAKFNLNEASVEQARLNLGYTVVRAPVDGIVSRKSVELGQVIQAGQPLLALVELENIWVTADYKETQLRHMRVGQPAIIKVDAYGGREYRGQVERVAAATGARFSLLPPENATGNYVKVVQRLPVKIVLDKGQDPQRLLRPGMSVDATVIVK